MKYWVLPANSKFYKYLDAFEDLKVLDWNISDKNGRIVGLEIGDIVFLYGSQEKRLAIKCEVVKIPVFGKDSIEDSMYGGFDKKDRIFARLKFIQNILDAGITMRDLSLMGINGNIQSARKLSNEIVDEIESRINMTSNKNNRNEYLMSATSLLNSKKQIILYGPAGTGKTYNTKSIIEAHSGEDYERLKSNGRVEFVTFHQSFAYEDFIEGIKPNLNEEVEGNISYKVEKGVFKELCEKAVISNRRLVEQSHEKITSNSKFWKISLGDSQTNEATIIYDYCIENDCIALGWNEDAKNSMFNRFKNEIKRGDLVFVSNGNRKIKALARVVGDFREEDTEIGYKNYRDVEWLIKDMNLATDKLFRSYFSQMSFYSLDNNKPDLEKLNEILVGNDVIEYSESTIKQHLEKFYKKTNEEKKKYF
ncbi:hypothetical protein [Francisella hispaniensis]|uniref:ATP/GTP-binding site motif A (P-loop) n=1 Tax=Francisella hispaniensis TaxID=622488 RepID=F4BJG8_9GAMM|nr:hypothetical protein [Francisella hispaniensis]AEB28312.1 ATP/GTP-binding site motif A (P-loop) [Francisella hispaniensis]